MRTHRSLLIAFSVSALSALSALSACDEAQSPSTPSSALDQALQPALDLGLDLDLSLTLDLELDQAAEVDQGLDLGGPELDQGSDMEPELDMSREPLPLREPAWLSVDEAEADPLPPDAWLAPRQGLSWRLQAEEGAALAAPRALWLFTRAWRAEEERWEVSFYDDSDELISREVVRVSAHGRRQLYGPARAPQLTLDELTARFERAQAEGAPPPFGAHAPEPAPLLAPEGAVRVALSAVEGAWLEGVALLDARLTLEEARAQAQERLGVSPTQLTPPLMSADEPPPPAIVREVEPCEGCLGEALAALLMEREAWVSAEEARRGEPLSALPRAELKLKAGEFVLSEPLVVQQDNVWLIGEGRERTKLTWSPSELGESAPAALSWRGRGALGRGWPLTELPSERGARTYSVSAPLNSAGEPTLWPLEARWATWVAEPWGEIPASCVGGRDVERRHRHEQQLVRVLNSAELLSAGSREVVSLNLDRAWSAEPSLEGRPQLKPTSLLRGGGVQGLRLWAACPEAFADESLQTRRCEVEATREDHGVEVRWVEGFELSEVEVAGFGRYALWVQQSLETTLLGLNAHHASDFGEGGRGYGVHLISTSRSLIEGGRFEVLRHGVVVDFGSTDSQVVSSYARRMPQALLDVHGEASRDTLLRGNTLSGAPLGVIIGGGGNEVHCNDGPRHLVERNVLSEVGVALAVSDATEQVRFMHNTMQSGLTLLSVAFGAGDVLLSGAWSPPSVRAPLLLSGSAQPLGEVRVERSFFEGPCTREEAALRFGEAPLAWGEGVWLCPPP